MSLSHSVWISYILGDFLLEFHFLVMFVCLFSVAFSSKTYSRFIDINYIFIATLLKIKIKCNSSYVHFCCITTCVYDLYRFFSFEEWVVKDFYVSSCFISVVIILYPNNCVLMLRLSQFGCRGPCKFTLVK